MAVEIHTDSPINGQPSQSTASVDGPAQTPAVSARTANGPASNLASSTGAVTSSPPYTSPRPAVAPPGPTSSTSATSALQLNPTRSYAPSPTSSLDTSSPPPPQPGQLPSPILPSSDPNSPRTNIPPPPKTGERLQPASYYTGQPGAYGNAPGGLSQSTPFAQQAPSQMSIPPPSELRGAGQPVAGTTAPVGTQGGHYLNPALGYLPPGSNTDGTRRGSAEHPQGYMQNPYAQGAGYSQGGYGSDNTTGGGGGMLGSLGFGRGGSGRNSPAPPGILTGDGRGEGNTYWDTVGGWVKGAGKKLAETEAKVWEMVDGKK